MKKILLAISLFFSIITAAAQTDDHELLVEIPQPPKTVERLSERCNYIVDKYWNTFNPKSSFSSLERLDKTLGQFFAFTPYATADTVHIAIDRLIQMVGKAKPENLITLAKIAERWTNSDTAEYASDELYFPFVEAVATNKKVKGPEKARFQAQYRQLANSRVGQVPANFEYTRPDGTKANFYDGARTHNLIFFYDPECTDCRLAKARLSADYVIEALLQNGMLAIYAIYPGQPDKAWADDAASLPASWYVGAYPDADLDFTMDVQPEIYYLDGSHHVLVKNISVDNILNAFHSFLTNPAPASQQSTESSAPAVQQGAEAPAQAIPAE